MNWIHKQETLQWNYKTIIIKHKHTQSAIASYVCSTIVYNLNWNKSPIALNNDKGELKLLVGTPPKILKTNKQTKPYMPNSQNHSKI